MAGEKMDMEKWYQKARKDLEQFIELMGECEWDESPDDILRDRLAIAFFGFPERCTEDNEKNLIKTYTKGQQESVNEILECIKRSKSWCSKIRVSFTLICGRMENGITFQDLVIRIPGDKFIDRQCRVYANWRDFEDNNQLPEGTILYPKEGKYKFDSYGLESCLTPACRVKQKVLKGVDIGTTVASLSTAAVVTGSLFMPIAAPILWVCYGTLCGTAAYGIGRNADILVDRADHEQTISPSDPHARSAWLGIATSTTSVAAGGVAAATKVLEASGASVSRAATIVLTATSGTHCATTALQVVHDIVHVASKEGDITAIDIMECVGSVLFFANAVTSTHQARMVLESLPPSNACNFSTFLKNISKLGTNEGSVRTNEGSVRTCTVLNNASLASVMPVLSLTAQIFVSIRRLCEYICENFKEFSKKFYEYYDTICTFVSNIWEIIKNVTKRIVEKVKQILHQFELFHFEEELHCLSYPELKKIEQVLDMSAKKENEIMQIISKISQFGGVENFKDFEKCIRFLDKFLHEEVQKKENDFQRMLEKGREDNLTEKVMERLRGIEGKRSEYFLRETLNKYCQEDCNFKFTKIIANFTKQKDNLGQIRESVSLIDTEAVCEDNIDIKVLKHEGELSMEDLIKSHVEGFNPELNDTYLVADKHMYMVKFSNHEKFKMVILNALKDQSSWTVVICFVTKCA